MKPSLPYRTLLAVAAMMLSASASAANISDTLKLKKIQVTTEGSHIEETLPEVLAAYGAQLEVITQEELERTGVNDVARALQLMVPGLHITTQAGRGSYVDISLQGSRSGDVLVLVDGVRINNRLYGSPTLDAITTNMIKRIEVLKGGQAVFYGTQAVAGVINIVLHDPGPEPGGVVTLGVGTLGDQRVSARITGKGLGGHWLLFGSADQSEGYKVYPESAYQPSARVQKRGFHRSTIGFKYHYSPGQGKSLQVLALQNRITAEFPHADESFAAYNKRERYIVSIKWDHKVTRQFGYFIKAYYHQWWTDWTSISMDAHGNIAVEYDRALWGFEDYGIQFKGRYVASDGSMFIAGIDTQHYWGKDMVVMIDSKGETTTGIFVQYRPVLSFSPATAITLGARYNFSRYSQDFTIWNVGVQQPLPSGMTLKFNASTAFKLPTAAQLFTVPQKPGDVRGNPNLEPERSIDTSLALLGRIQPSIQWRVTGFYREITNLITVKNNLYVNSDQGVRVRGGGVGLRIGNEAGLQFRVSGTYAHAVTVQTNERIAGIPKWYASAGLIWTNLQASRGWRVSVRHTGDRFTILHKFGREEYGSFTVVNASAWFRFGDKNRNKITVRINNATDLQYATALHVGTRPDGSFYQYKSLGPPLNVQIEFSRTF